MEKVFNFVKSLYVGKVFIDDKLNNGNYKNYFYFHLYFDHENDMISYGLFVKLLVSKLKNKLKKKDLYCLLDDGFGTTYYKIHAIKIQLSD